MEIRISKDTNTTKGIEEEEYNVNAIDYVKILRTFTNKHTCELYQRQIALLNKIYRGNPDGYKIADLVYITKILEIAIDLIETESSFIGPICKLIDLCAKPFHRMKSNEELLNTEPIDCIIKKLSEWMNFNIESIQLSAAQALQQLSMGICTDKRKKETQSTKQKKNSILDGSLSESNSFAQQIFQTNGVVVATISVLKCIVHFISSVHHHHLPKELSNYNSHSHSDSPSLENKTHCDHSSQSTTHCDNSSHFIECNNSYLKKKRILLVLMKLLRRLSLWSNNMGIMIREGMLLDVISIMDYSTSLNDELLLLSVDILWNLLEQCDHEMRLMGTCSSRKKLLNKFRTDNAIYVLGTPLAFEVLHRKSKLFLETGYRAEDKELRNDIFILVDYLSRRRKNHDLYRECGFLELTLLYSTAAEMGKKNEVFNFHHFSSCCKEDFELKQIMWMVISNYCKSNPKNLQLVHESDFFQVLLMYLKESKMESTRNVFNQWTMSQKEVLQHQALSILFTLVSPQPEFLLQQLHASSILLCFVQKANTMDLMHDALQILLQVSSIDQDELGNLGCIQLMLNLASDMSILTDIRRDAVSILSLSCRDHKRNQDVFRETEGIVFLKENLIYQDSDALTKKNIIVSIVDALWNCVIGNLKSESDFLQFNGVYKLLELLENCPVFMQGQVLGVLADLCEKNQKAIQFVKSWRSEESLRNTMQLLFFIYKQEEKRLKVERLPNGIISYLLQPLQAHFPISMKVNHYHLSSTHSSMHPTPLPFPLNPMVSSSKLAFVRLKNALRAGHDLRDPDPANVFTEAMQDLREKVFILLNHIGFSCLDSHLTYQEQIDLCFIENYHCFRMAEEWLHVQDELEKEGIKPISPDRLYIENYLQDALATAVQLQETQTRILEIKNKEDHAEEKAFFQKILLQKEQEFQIQLSLKQRILPKTKNSFKSRPTIQSPPPPMMTDDSFL